jgi:hypothetical protein
VKDMDALKMDPQGVGRIGQPAVREGVASKKIAEFIVHSGLGNSADQTNHGATGKCEQPNHYWSQRPPPSFAGFG